MKIIFEDENLIAVVKEPGEPSQGDKTGDEDIVTKLSARTGSEVFVVHRLDRPVGGVMVYAKNKRSAAYLSEALKETEMGKRYMAVVCGKVKNDSGSLKNYIAVDSRKNISKIVTGPKVMGAKEALLSYNKVAYDSENDLTLLDIKLFTGRHHQIRVQLANMGNPIWGDVKYNRAFLRKKAFPALWSYEVEIKTEDGGIISFREMPTQYPFDIFEIFLKKY